MSSSNPYPELKGFLRLPEISTPDPNVVVPPVTVKTAPGVSGQAVPKITTKQVRQALAYVRQGHSIAKACTLAGTTKWSFYRTLDRQPEVLKAFQEARKEGLDRWVDAAEEIAEERPPTDERGRTDGGYVAWQRLRIDTIFKFAKAINPVKYGERVTAAGDPEHPIEYRWAEAPIEGAATVPTVLPFRKVA